MGPRIDRPYVTTKVKVLNASTFAITDSNLILVNFAGAVTVTLPGVYTTGPGSPIPPRSRRITVTDYSGAAATNNITVVPASAGSATIGGLTSYLLATNYGSVTFEFDGANWEVVGARSRVTDLAPSKFTSSAMSSANAIAAGELSGAEYTYVAVTAATPGTCTTRTAAQLFGDIPNCVPGYAYSLRVVNTSANTLTFAAGTNVTFTGTSTVATNVTRDYCVTFGNTTGNAATVTFQSVGSGTSP